MGSSSDKENAKELIASLFGYPVGKWNDIIEEERDKKPIYSEEILKIVQDPDNLPEVSALMELFFMETE
jgi:hypothetical protein